MKRIPHNAVLKALYTRLSATSGTGNTPLIGCKIYDDVPEEAVVPYATFGDFSCNDSGTKSDDITEITINVNIYSDYAGRKELNTIANAILDQVYGSQLTLDDGFSVVDCNASFYEAFTEDMEGYNGVITLTMLIQNNGGN